MDKEINDRSINPLIRRNIEEILRAGSGEDGEARLREPDDIKGDW
jgi:hypothetical protein